MDTDNLNWKVTDYFEAFYKRIDCGFEFTYSSCTEKEYWFKNGLVREVPQGIWIAHHHLPDTVNHLFIAQNCTDILCFSHVYPQYVDNTVSPAFASLGYLASKGDFKNLINKFINAKIHLISENSLIGKVFDCRIALWSRGIDSKYQIIGNSVALQFGVKMLTIPIEKFSLNYFEIISNNRFSFRTHKPAKGFLSFHKLFAAL